jgi:regulatory protein
MIEDNGAVDRELVRPMRSSRQPTGRAGTRPASAAPAPLDRALLETWALFYLERYASSAENLRHVLLRRVRRRVGTDGEAVGAAGALIDALLVRYRAAGLLDDVAYAAGQARRAQAHGRSLRRIAAGLAAKGVGREDAAAAVATLAEGAADPDLAAACAFARRRRLGPFRPAPLDAADRRRELAAFARAGFERRTAEAVLGCADETAVAALLKDTG